MKLLLRFFGFLFAAGTILFISGREGRESPVTVGVSPGSVSLAATMRF